MSNLPEGLTPLPEGAAFLGRPCDFAVPDGGYFKGWIFCEKNGQWKYGYGLRGDVHNCHYAAPADSEIARLNGLSPDPNDGLPFGLTWDSPELEGYDEVRLSETSFRLLGRRAGIETWTLIGLPKHIVENSLVTRPKPECAGKVVEIDGKRFRLVPVEADSE